MSDLATLAPVLTGIWNFAGGAATNIFNSVALAITAGATQTQAGATALTKHINQVTVVGTNGDGVALPSAAPGMFVLIINADASGTNTLKVYPATGDDVGAGVNTVSATQIAKGSARLCFAIDATNWVCLTDIVVLA